MTIPPATDAAVPGLTPVVSLSQPEPFMLVADIQARRRSGLIGQTQAIVEIISVGGLTLCDAARLVVADRTASGTANSQ